MARRTVRMAAVLEVRFAGIETMLAAHKPGYKLVKTGDGSEATFTLSASH